MLIASSGSPIATVAYVAWALAALALVAGAVTAARVRRDKAGVRSVLLPVGLFTLAVVAGAAGGLAYVARSGAMATPAGGPEVAASSTLTPTLSPVPTAPDAPEKTSVTPTSGAGSDEQSAEPIQIGFESIGTVGIGDSSSKIEGAFGSAATTAPTTAPDGKSATAYTIEGKNKDFVVYARNDRVRAYAVRSSGFVTFSGVAVGDSQEALKKAYGSRLRSASGGAYVLDGPNGSSVKFTINAAKIVQIDGGLIT